MWPDRVSNPGPLTYESGALPIALRGPARFPYKGYTFYSRTSMARTLMARLPRLFRTRS